MGGNKIVYKEAYEQALAGRSRTLWQRLTLPFQDFYTRSSREQGERDGTAARLAATGEAVPLVENVAQH
jgi:ribosome modulation factor